MADVATVATKEAGEDTQHLNAIFGSIQSYRAEIAELKQLLKKSHEENEWLRDELRAHQRGERTQIVIEGRSFTLKLDGPEPLPVEAVTITDAWINDQPRKHDTTVLGNSLVAFKE